MTQTSDQAISAAETAPAISPLKIAVLGAGKIGSAFAFQLACVQLARVGHHDVTVISRPGSAKRTLSFARAD